MSNRNHHDRWLYNPPMKCEMGGFTSDTAMLARHGWRFAVEERMDYDGRQIQIIMKHDENQIMAISDIFDIQMSTMMHHRMHGQDIRDEYWKNIFIRFQRFSTRVHIQSFQKRAEVQASYTEIDMIPHYEMESGIYEHDVYEMNIFKNKTANSVILEEAEVPQLMAMILSKQQDRKMEVLRESMKIKNRADLIII
jgi:glutamate synthase domain-containing protein 2